MELPASILRVLQDDRSGRCLTKTTLPMRLRLLLDLLVTLDCPAKLHFADGFMHREELYYGSSYLSRSSRMLWLPSSATEVAIHGGQGVRPLKRSFWTPTAPKNEPGRASSRDLHISLSSPPLSQH